jgi:hypothetical protein
MSGSDLLNALWSQIETNDMEMNNTTQDLFITLRDNTSRLEEAAKEINDMLGYLDMIEEQFRQFKSALQHEVNTMEDELINGNLQRAPGADWVHGPRPWLESSCLRSGPDATVTYDEEINGETGR